MATVTAQQTIAAVEALVTVITKIAATVSLDVSNPLNLLNFSADLALVSEIKTAVADGEAVIADLKAAL